MVKAAFRGADKDSPERHTLAIAIEVAGQEAINSAANPGQEKLAEGFARHLRENFDEAMNRKVELADITQEAVDYKEWEAFSMIVEEAQEVFWKIMRENATSIEEGIGWARSVGSDDI